MAAHSLFSKASFNKTAFNSGNNANSVSSSRVDPSFVNPSCVNHSSGVKGFSLLEVLIALVVLATALMALSGTLSLTFNQQVFNKEKTFAQYVASYRLGELRIEPNWPNEGTTRGEIEMLKINWQWQQVVTKTTEPDLRRVEISISKKNDIDYKLAKITAFLGKPSKDAKDGIR